MNIVRQQELVEAFHYDMNVGDNKAETEIRVEIKPIDMSDEKDFPVDESSVLGLRVVYQIMFEEFALTGAVRQLVTLPERKVDSAEDFEQEELDEIMQPLFAIIERMTYEVTEIALDRPGVQLNFEKTEE